MAVSPELVPPLPAQRGAGRALEAETRAGIWASQAGTASWLRASLGSGPGGICHLVPEGSEALGRAEG